MIDYPRGQIMQIHLTLITNDLCPDTVRAVAVSPGVPTDPPIPPHAPPGPKLGPIAAARPGQ